MRQGSGASGLPAANARALIRAKEKETKNEEEKEEEEGVFLREARNCQCRSRVNSIDAGLKARR